MALVASGGLAGAIHADRHAIGGADPLTPADIGAATVADMDGVLHGVVIALGAATPADLPTGWLVFERSV